MKIVDRLKYDEFSASIGGKCRDKIEVKCGCEGCGYVSSILKTTALMSFKKHGKYMCMSCAQSDGWNCVLTSEEKDILLGSLLGDACIKAGRTKMLDTALVTFEHSIKQKEYVLWKYSKLERLATCFPKERKNQGYGDLNVKFDTKLHSCFRPIYDMVIKDGVKTITKEWLNSIVNPISLAVWYMDDGSIDKNGSCCIATDGFTIQEIDALCSWMTYVWNIDCKTNKHGKYYKMRLSNKGRDKLFHLIGDYVIDQMNYKIKPPALTRRLLDEVMVEEAILLKSQGQSYSETARKHGFEEHTISTAIRRQMDMIVDSDLGHDPDDFFTLCYLIAAGVNITAIVVTPGDRDQLAVARLLSEELGLNVPIGAHKHSEKYSVGGVHREILKKYGRSLDGEPDGFGKDIIAMTPDSHVLVIGPPSNIGRYLEDGGQPPAKCTMQGGFLPYNLHEHKVERLEKFENKDWVPTFNMNGDRKGTMAILDSNIGERRFCGKNVCHTVLLTPDRMTNFRLKNRASELFVQFGYILFDRHSEKKFHDPIAACCHLHPEIGTWVRGTPIKMESGWSTRLDDDGDYVLADINRDTFWERMYTFS